MTVLEIALSGAEGVVPLFYRVKQTPVAQRWLTYLETMIKQQGPIEPHVVNGRTVAGHFIGFPNTDINRETLAVRINECIDVLNSHAPGAIDMRATPEQGQPELNRLHKYFERYRGQVDDPPPTFASAPEYVKRALENFNYLVHDFENVTRKDGGDEEQATVSMEVVFLGRTRHRLLDEDFEQFKIGGQFGEIQAHYCEVGKEILDVYADGDTIVGDDNIRPQRYISADFDCHFGASWSEEYVRTYRAKLDPWLRENGYEPADERLSLGRIALATLILDQRFEGLTRKQIVEWLSRYMNVRKVIVHR
jgi:hypothetical protein